MIVDCHTQLRDAIAFVVPDDGRPSAAIQALFDASRFVSYSPVDRAIVLGFKSRYLEAEIPNQCIADYVRTDSGRLVGFAGLDPTDASWRDELNFASLELKLKGVTIAPAMQDYHPCDSHAMRLYAECEHRGLPIIVEHKYRHPASKLEYARPYLFDEVARAFPLLRIVISHLGFPWIDETIVLLAKHPRVYADVSSLIDQPWIAYNALLTAYQSGVIDKLLFGSDFPSRSPAACIEALYSINRVGTGSTMAGIPRESLRGIVERDALRLLGIDAGLLKSERPPLVSDDE